MFYYKRKTAFIDYYINGIKSRSIGIVKQKIEDDNLWMAVELSGLEDWKNMSCKVSMGDVGEKFFLFDMQIRQGKGSKEFGIPLKEMQGRNCRKLFLSFGNDCYGMADLCEIPNDLCESEETIPEAEDEETEAVMEEIEESEPAGNTEEPEECELREQEILADCLEPQPDKWEVIKKKYPILYPFRGQGPYVSIKPVDLQLLDQKYHHLSDNSYLMHAFYRYRHMILGEYAQEKGTFFYVGVPGEFIKKEQSSAAMFGFEGYEHSGDLGYYLYRVEL